MKQQRKPAARAAGDEGAAYTRIVMAEVKRLRNAMQPEPWTAARLAAEMTAVGVPWTRNTVTNLETGRRKSLHAHELLALAYVLDAPSAVDLLVPQTAARIPVTPAVEAATLDARAWCWGQTGPLRGWLAAEPFDREAIRMKWFRAEESAVLSAHVRLNAAQAGRGE
jgi:transcriptional regulator with XRE-family HTH domain